MIKYRDNFGKWIELAELKNGKVKEEQLPPFGLCPELIVTALSGSTITISNGQETLSATEQSGTWTFSVPSFGVWTVSAEKGSKKASEEIEILMARQYFITINYSGIYGVSWDGTSDPKTSFSRTEDAVGFTDPVPYLQGMDSSRYGSPFDNIMPWSGMTVVEDAAAGSLVQIPKFYYKLTKEGSGMNIQISNSQVEGFSVSPAHMARGTDYPEKDIVYVGRYHCASSTLKSTSGVKPQTQKSRSTFRTDIHNLGTDIYQMDFAMRFTIWLLYIVEFANFDSQAAIGRGCGNDSGVEDMGYTDSMPYHTGTMLLTRTTYGVGTQYRNIEGLWDNVYDWFDGCYNNNNGLNIILNPDEFSDTTGGTLVGKPSTDYPSAFDVNSNGGFSMFYPTASGGNASTYTCDYWNFESSRPCLCGGGDYYQGLGHGLFYVYHNIVSYSGDELGARLMKL